MYLTTKFGLGYASRFLPYPQYHINYLSLIRSASTMFLDVNKADGNGAGINSPATNPMVDLANEVGKNLFNMMRPEVKDGFLINVEGNLYIDGPSFADENYYTALGSEVTISVAETTVLRVAWYDSNKTFIKRDFTTTAKFLTSVKPVNGAFYRVSGVISQKPTFQLELGSVPTAYEPYARNDLSLQNYAFTAGSGYEEIDIFKVYDDDPNPTYGSGFRVVDGVVDYSNITEDGINNNVFISSIEQLSEFQIRVIGTDNDSWVRFERKLYVKPSTQYTSVLTAIFTGTHSNVYLYQYDSNGTSLGTIALFDTQQGESRKLFTTNALTAYVRLRVGTKDDIGNPATFTLDGIYEGDYVTGNPPLPTSGVYESGNSKVKTVTALKCDGVDDYGILPNSADLDPTGLDDFGMAFVIKTGSDFTGKKAIYVSNDNNDSTTQISVQIADNGTLEGVIGGSYQLYAIAGSILINTFYSIVIKRVNQNIVCNVNRIKTQNATNTSILISKNNKRMFARCTNSNGSTHDRFFNGHALTADFTLDPSESWESAFNKYCQQAYGL